MLAIAYPAELKDGEVHELSTRPVHVERWPSWIFQSNRRIVQRFERGLDQENHLNEGACFRILIHSEDSHVPRYELNAKYTGGQLRII